jgi:hypothetical protein
LKTGLWLAFVFAFFSPFFLASDCGYRVPAPTNASTPLAEQESAGGISGLVSGLFGWGKKSS